MPAWFLDRRWTRYERMLAGFVVFALIGVPAMVSAATKTWDGGGAGTNCSTGGNWSGDTAPARTDDIVLDSTSTKDVVWDSSCPTKVMSWSQNSGYTGAVSFSITNFNISGSLVLAAGTLTAPSGTLNIEKTFTRTAGTFTHNSGTVKLSSSGAKTFTPGGQTFNSLLIDNGLVGYWKFDEGTGTSAADSSQFRNNGTLTNGPVWSGSVLPPRINFYNPKGLRFDGTNDSVRSTTFTHPAYAVSLWFKPNSAITTSSTCIVPFATAVTSEGDYVALGSCSSIITNEVITVVKGVSRRTFVASITISATAWHHLVISWNAATTRYLVYLDGALQTTSNASAGHASLFNANTFFRIGEYNASSYFPGAIDDVRVYNRALSLSEVTSLYNGTRSTSSGSYTLASDLTLAGNLNIYNGTLNVSGTNYAVNVASNVNLQGDFTKQSGTFTLNGTGNQVFSGSILANNFTATASTARTVTFDYTSRVSVSGALVLQGAVGNLLSLRSMKADSPASLYLDAQSGTQTIDYLNVKDSSGYPGAALVCNTATEGCVNAGGNIFWVFGTATSINGTLYSDQGVTTAGSSPIALSLNGGPEFAILTDGSGVFAFDYLNMTGGTLITLYSTGSNGGVTVTLGSGSTMNGMNVYGKTLIVRSDSGSIALTNAHLNAADANGSTDISALYSVNSSGNLGTLPGKTLFVWPGDLYTPGGKIATFNFTNSGTTTMGLHTLLVSGSLISKGTLTSSTGTILTSRTTSNTLTVASGTLENLTINNGLVAYWKLDEATGTIASDSTRNRYNGTLTSGPVWSGSNLSTRITFYNPYGLRLDGSNDYVTVPTNDDFNPGLKDFTITLWVKPRTVSVVNYLIGKYTVASKGFLFAISSAAKLIGYLNSDSPTVTGATSLTTTTWHHIALRRIGGTANVYLNGAIDGTTNGLSATNATSTNPLLIGRISESATTATVTLDDIRFYNRALSTSEIAALYAGGRNTGSGVYTLGSSLSLSGSLNIFGGEINASSSNYGISVSGDVNIQGGFAKQSGSFTLNGAGTQTVSGSTFFHNFTATASSPRTIQFDVTSRQSFSGSLVLQGAASNLLTLRSMSAATQAYFYLDPTSGSQDIRYLDLKDNNASSGSTLICRACTDSGNTKNWSFAALQLNRPNNNYFQYFGF